jgi:hypothetical protein
MAAGNRSTLSPGSVHPGPMAVTTRLPESAMKALMPSVTQRDVDVTAPTWSVVTGGATQITSSPTDPINCSGTTTGHGSIFVLSTQPAGADKYIWEGDGQGNWCNLPGLASQISAAPNGTLYAINSGGEIYSWNGTSWTGIAGRATGVTAASDNSVYVLSNQNGSGDEPIWHYSGGTWTWIPGSGVQMAASWDTNSYTIPGGTVAPGGFYILTSAGYIYYGSSDGSTYIGLPGQASAISGVQIQNGASSGGGVYALGYPANPTSGTPIWYYDLNTPGWTTEQGAGVSISAVTNKTNATWVSTLYVVGASNAIYSSPITVAATPTPTPIQAFTNGGFETGNLTGWYTCGAPHEGYPNPVDPSPAPDPSATSAVTQSPEPVPSTSASPAFQVVATVAVPTATVTAPATAFPSQTMVPHGGTYAMQVGVDQPGKTRPKGFIGVCQDVTVPAYNAQLTVYVWEGGNNGQFYNSDTEVDLYDLTGGATTWTTSSWTNDPYTYKITTTATPDLTLMAETNCYNNLDTSGGAATNIDGCATPHPAQPPTSTGGQWWEKGPYDLSAYAGKSVTIMIGSYGSSTSAGYYEYTFVDDASLTGSSTPADIHRRTSQIRR